MIDRTHARVRFYFSRIPYYSNKLICSILPESLA